MWYPKVVAHPQWFQFRQVLPGDLHLVKELQDPWERKEEATDFKERRKLYRKMYGADYEIRLQGDSHTTLARIYHGQAAIKVKSIFFSPLCLQGADSI